MNTKFIILLALIVGTFATDDAIATLQKMENSKFGRTILSTIQI